MGNLRQSYTDEEWNEIVDRIEQDRRNGKPESIFITLDVSSKSLTDLIALRNFLDVYYSDSDLYKLDKWITWKEKTITKEY
jgi:hypothetical protein